jgi:protein O-GlcNAc transferase
MAVLGPFHVGPSQVTWIGYPNTTGLAAIDYRITDAVVDPVATKQKHVEELYRLPGCFLCYTPSPAAPPVSVLPAKAHGFITFGSFNNLAKITRKVMAVWGRILRAIPTSRFVIKCKPFSSPTIQVRPHL